MRSIRVDLEVRLGEIEGVTVSESMTCNNAAYWVIARRSPIWSGTM